MKLGFIGTGNMAGAIMGGIIKKGIIPAEEIIGSDIMETGRNHVKELYGIQVTADNKESGREGRHIGAFCKTAVLCRDDSGNPGIRKRRPDGHYDRTGKDTGMVGRAVWQTGQDRAYHPNTPALVGGGDDGSLARISM